MYSQYCEWLPWSFRSVTTGRPQSHSFRDGKLGGGEWAPEFAGREAAGHGSMNVMGFPLLERSNRWILEHPNTWMIIPWLVSVVECNSSDSSRIYECYKGPACGSY